MTRSSNLLEANATKLCNRVTPADRRIDRHLATQDLSEALGLDLQLMQHTVLPVACQSTEAPSQTCSRSIVSMPFQLNDVETTLGPFRP